MILNPQDISLVIKQCENQKATKPEDLVGFALAYGEAKEIGYKDDPKEWCSRDFLYWILNLAELVDKDNPTGYRCVPVTFVPITEHALDPKLIQRALESYTEAFLDGRFKSADEAYLEFEKIHPFKDGNGRVGHLLWAIYTVWSSPDNWPTTLPPKFEDLVGE